jgi:hypothetical protein
MTKHPTPPAEGPRLDRRGFLAGTAATGLLVTASAVIHTGEAWGLEPKALQPSTVATLVKMARDIYPHDRVGDRFYAVAIKSLDEKLRKDAAMGILIEGGIKALDAAARKAHKVPYASVGWEEQRVKLLQSIEKTPFFQSVRGGLVVSLYNQKELWPLFGYEGESASKGGYIARGFNDITWL